MRSTSSCSDCRVMASSAPNGSSISRTVGILRQAARDLQALLHAARELRGILVGMVAEPDLGQQRRNAAAALGRRHADRLERQADVAGRRAPGQQRAAVVLEHESDVARRPAHRLRRRDARAPAVGAPGPPAGAAGWSCRSPMRRSRTRTRRAGRRTTMSCTIGAAPEIETDALEREGRVCARHAC